MEKAKIFETAKQVVNYTNQLLSLGPANSFKAQSKNVAFAGITRLGQMGKEIIGTIPGTNPTDFVELQSEEQKHVRAIRDAYLKHFTKKIYVGGRESFVLSPSMFPVIESFSASEKTGCCGEFAVVSFQRFVNQYQFGNGSNPDVELVRAPGHWIVVVNRGKELILGNPLTWNEDSIICDAWSRKVFYGQNYNQCWKNSPTVSIRYPDITHNQYITIDDWNSW